MAGIIPETAEQRHRRMRDEAQQGSTYHDHTRDDLDQAGRYARHEGAATIVGAKPITPYPASALSGQPDAGLEPALGYCIDDMVPLEPSAVSPSAQATGGPPDAP